MSACAMEIEPSGSSIPANPCCVVWKQSGAANKVSSASKNLPVRLCSAEELASAMCNDDQADNLLIIDTRSFLEFNTMRVQTAVNVCCSKIMKRRLQNDKVTIKDLLESTCATALPRQSSRIVLYDQCTQDLALLASDCFLVVLLAKLAREYPNVALLRGGFLYFSTNFPQLCEKTRSAADLSEPLLRVYKQKPLHCAQPVTPLNNNQPSVVNQNLMPACASIPSSNKSETLPAVNTDIQQGTCASGCSQQARIRNDAAGPLYTLGSLTEARSPVGCAFSEPSTPLYPAAPPSFGIQSTDDCDGARMACSGVSASAPSELKRGSVPHVPLAERVRLLSPGTGASGAVSGPCLPVTFTGPSRILPFLFLGSQHDAFDQEVIKANGITHVINVSATCPQTPLVRLENFMRIPVNDSFYERLSGHFRKAFDFIERARAENGCTLVHCLAGISRSPTITIAFIMHLKGMSSDEAYKLVKRARPAIAPNLNFLGQLLEYENLLKLEAQESTGENSSLVTPASACGSIAVNGRSLRLSFSNSSFLSASTIASPNAKPPSVNDAGRSSNANDVDVTMANSQSVNCNADVDGPKPLSDVESNNELHSGRKVSAQSLVANVSVSTKLRHVETIVCHSAYVSSRCETQSQPAKDTNADVGCSSKRQCLPQARSFDMSSPGASGEKRCPLLNRRLCAKSSGPKFDFSAIHNADASKTHIVPEPLPPPPPPPPPNSESTLAPASVNVNVGSHTPTTPTNELAKLSFSNQSVCADAAAAAAAASAAKQQVTEQTCQTQSCTSALMQFATVTTSSLKAVTFTTCASAKGGPLRSSASMPLTSVLHSAARTPSPARRQALLVDSSNSALQASSGGSSTRRCTDERENMEHGTHAAVAYEARTTTRCWKSLTNVNATGHSSNSRDKDNVLLPDSASKLESGCL